MAKKIDINGLDHFKEKENAMIASEYSSSKTYAVGDYVYHAGTLYCCTTAITTAEAWTSGHWTAAKLADDCSSLKTAFTESVYLLSDDITEKAYKIEKKYVKSDGDLAESNNWRIYYYRKSAISLFTDINVYAGANPNSIVAVAFYSSETPTAASFLGYIPASTPNALNSLKNITFPEQAVIAVITNRNTAGTPTIYGIERSTETVPQIENDVEIINKRLNKRPLDFIQTIDYTSTGGISSLTIIDNVLYMFAYTSAEEETTGKKYSISENGTLTYLEDFTSNIGHQNTVDYSPENKALVSVRGTQAIAPIYDIYVFENVDSNTDDFDINGANAIRYDVSNVGLGSKALNAVWGFDNFGKNDILIVFTRDDELSKRYVSIMQLGKGSNQLESGTFISGKEANQFNGTFKIQYTIERPYVSGENTNDMCFYKNKIYEVSTQEQIGIKMFVHSFEDFNTTISTHRMLIERFNAQGTGTSREYEGVAIGNGYMYVGSIGTGLYVFNAPE